MRWSTFIKSSAPNKEKICSNSRDERFKILKRRKCKALILKWKESIVLNQQQWHTKIIVEHEALTLGLTIHLPWQGTKNVCKQIKKNWHLRTQFVIITVILFPLLYTMKVVSNLETKRSLKCLSFDEKFIHSISF